MLRLPRPSNVYLDVRGEFGRSDAWELGLHAWYARIGVTWAGEEFDALVAAVRRHLEETPRASGSKVDALAGRPSEEGGSDAWEHKRGGWLRETLQAHGIQLDDEGQAWIGQQDVITIPIYSDTAQAAGRRAINSAEDLWMSADDHSQELSRLVEPLTHGPSADGEGGLFCPELSEVLEEADTANSVLLLRSVNVTPVMRGHRLGAWAAATCVSVFDTGAMVVATEAAPLSKRDAIPEYDREERADLTPEQSERWKAGQDWLVRHWTTGLGLTPLPWDPSVLVCQTTRNNAAMRDVLAEWKL